MRALEELYNIEDISKQTAERIKSFRPEDLLADEYEHRYEIFMDTVSSGSAGSHQPAEIAEFFGMQKLLSALNKKSEESRTELQQNMIDFAWEYIDKHADDIACLLNQKIKIPEYNGHFYFGHLEADGSYGLFYTWTIEQDEK